MRGQWESQTRRLNRHYQSAGQNYYTCTYLGYNDFYGYSTTGQAATNEFTMSSDSYYTTYPGYVLTGLSDFISLMSSGIVATFLWRDLGGYGSSGTVPAVGYLNAVLIAADLIIQQKISSRSYNIMAVKRCINSSGIWSPSSACNSDSYWGSALVSPNLSMPTGDENTIPSLSGAYTNTGAQADITASAGYTSPAYEFSKSFCEPYSGGTTTIRLPRTAPVFTMTATEINNRLLSSFETFRLLILPYFYINRTDGNYFDEAKIICRCYTRSIA